MLQLTFTDRPLNSVVVNTATYQVLYDIKTPHLLGGSLTTVRDATGDIVATYETSAYTHELTIGGERRGLNEWLEREHTFSLSRRMHAPNGRQYAWTRSKYTWSVTDCETGQVIAMSRSASKVDGTKFTVDILEDGLPILDAIVTAFAILEARAKADADAGSTVGYDPMPVCAFCIEMLQITASGKGQLKQLPMAKLKKYAKAYNIDVSGILEKDEFIERLVAARTPEGCLPHANESYYRKHSIPNRASNRPRGIFTRAMDAMSGDRTSTSSTPPPRQQPQPQYQQRQQYQQYPQYTQYQPRQRTNSGPSRYSPHSQTDPRTRQQQPQQQAPRPSTAHPHPHPHPQYAPPPGAPPRYSQSARPDHLNVPPQRPRAASTSSTPRGTSPARPVVVPSIDELLKMSDEQVAALSIGSLKEILFKNHVTARLVVEKGELVSRVKTLIEQEKAERERKAAEEAAEREYEEQMRRAREESLASASQAGLSHPASPGPARAEGNDGEGANVQIPIPEPAGTGEGVQMPVPQPATGEDSGSPPQASTPPTRVVTPPPASTLTPKAQAMASRLERTGLCVICQDEEANIAIVDCGCVVWHLSVQCVS
ncbi:hypothetical protein DICSQDRAFT_175405 [Dichomitus squalens LYAD-421 SS1]|uniref:DUF6593 domain-containing protein n=1 Tax=Dichomitus squalens (strain LYAD-421) TaxID=732165 RepID=R7SJH5_DICSQ|nr:uncharacterized protein DICSQDRAFT_175405 [Dichomitus squalens LYAD-421 SS1]EJF55880.1 hypothetical protein DICSQDRAFT_175405 [Dichomitus squalens LYAD-421 SS1]